LTSGSVKDKGKGKNTDDQMATTGRYSCSNHKLISLNDSTAKDKGKGKAVDNFMEQYDRKFS